MSPASLQALLGPGFVGDTQYWLKRLYWKFTYNNVNHIPVYFDLYYVRARRDIANITDQTFINMANDDVSVSPTSVYQPIQIPYTSPFTSDTWRKNWKIISHKRRLLLPMRPKTFYVKIKKSYLNRAICQETEGSTSYFSRRGDVMVHCRFTGIPVNYQPATESFQGVILGPIAVRGVLQQYASYYVMDDVTPTSIITQDYNLTLDAQNLALMPTYTQATTAMSVADDYPAGVTFVSEAPPS